MKKTVKAFAPGNISCIFKICEGTAPEKMGSVGLGFTVDKGVVATVSLDRESEIYFNREKINFHTVSSVVAKLSTQPIRVDIASELPLGAGLGVSGASAIATAYALNKLLNLGKKNLDLAKIAHVAEVENKTGLGDVTNQYFGGFLLKTVSSSLFKVSKLPIINLPVYFRIFSGISTKSILQNPNLRKKIDEAADIALHKIDQLSGKNFNLNELIKISYEFAVNSGLMKNKRVIQLIREIKSKSGIATMIMLGNSVVSDTAFQNSTRILISDKKAHVL